VLGASPEWRPPPPEHPVRLHTAMVFERPADPAQILSRGPCWHAVVVDLDAERLVDPATVAQAWSLLAGLCDRERVQSLAVPPLGAVHGDLAVREALQLLHDGLLVAPPAALRRVWLQVTLRHLVSVEKTLAAWGAESG